MGNFKATYWDGSAYAITTNGTTLSIEDNSNYQNYTDQAQGGAASYITLAATASSYTDYYKGMQVEILSGTGVGDKQMITAYNGTTKRATVASWTGSAPDGTSVYEIGERGHLKSYFTDYRKIYIFAPTVTWTLSSLGDGDASTSVPSVASLPITDTYNYTDGDGVYRCKLYVAPTWSATIAYLSVMKVCVYYGGELYKLLKNDTGTIPGTDATVWELLSSVDDLYARYIADQYIAITCDINDCWRNKMEAANGKLMCNPCNTEVLIRDLEVQRALQMSAGIFSIPALAAKGYWTSAENHNANVQDTVSFLKNLCCCTTP